MPTAVDISVVSTLQKGLLVAGAAKAGHALALRVASKTSLHNAACEGAGVSFSPLVVETLGGWDAAAVRLVQQLASFSSRRLGTVYSVTVSQMFQRLSLILQRGNAILLTSKVPLPPLNVLGV